MMTHGPGEQPTLPDRSPMLPWLILICGLAATALGTHLLYGYIQIKNEQRAHAVMGQMEERLQTRMDSYLGLLRGGSGLFAANQFVTLEQFRSFWQRLEIPTLYPGMQGFGFTVRVLPDRVPALQQMLALQGITNVQVWPAGARDEYHAIIYLEPQDERNRRALGYDMFTEPVRRAAMSQARDAGKPVMSGKVRLVQEDLPGPKQNGFLIYMPVYFGGATPSSEEERRSKLHGFVYSPFRAGDLLEGIYGPDVPSFLQLSIYDGESVKAEALLASLGAEVPSSSKQYISQRELAGRKWTLVYHFSPDFFQGSERLLIISPVVGLLVSFSLFFLTRAEALARRRAEGSAQELKNQRQWLETMLGSIADGVISTNAKGEIQFMNPIAEKLTGWRWQEAQGRPLAEIFDVVDEESREVVENPVEQVIRTGQVISPGQHTSLIQKDGSELCVDASASPILDVSGRKIGAILVFRDITVRRKAERRVNAQHAVTRVLAESSSLPEAAKRLLEVICSHMNFAWGVFWLASPEDTTAEAISIYHLPNFVSTEFLEACRRFQPEMGEGLPGMVWERGEPMAIRDFNDPDLFPRASAARAIGIQSAYAFPILRDGKVYGVLEFFSRERYMPDDELNKVAKGLGSQIGQFLERTGTAAALRESEELYRTISETAADGILMINEESTILKANSAAERIFGYQSGELIGRSLSELMPPRLREAHREGIRRYLRTGEKRIPWNSVELPGLTRDGRDIPLEISFGETVREGKHIFVGLIRDVSKRREAEERLRQAEERFRLLVNQAQEYAIITADPAGLVSTWNLGAQRIFGYSEPEILGRPLSLLFTLEDRVAKVPEEEMRTAAEQGQSLSDRWLARKDGSRFWASGSMICLRQRDGAPRAYAKILRDMTERKRTEEAIREINQELELRVQRRTAALLDSKEQMEAFTYTVAHDLRAPLRSMQGFSQALLEDYAPKLDENAKDFIRRIMSSSQKMDALIQDLLSYSQLSRSDLHFQSVPVLETIYSVLDHLQDEIQRTNAEVKVQGDPVEVLAHAATFQHVLSNLIANALKFTKPGQVPQILIQTINQDRLVRISVRDNGIGIAPEHHDRIFRVFERLHGQEAYPGTGIGLAIVKKGVERMGGDVGVDSSPGQGSVFWIELPRAS